MPTFPPRPGTVRPGLYRPEEPSPSSLNGVGGIVVAGPILAGVGTTAGGLIPAAPPTGGTFAPTPTARVRRRLRGRGGIRVAGPILAASGHTLRPRLTATGQLTVAGPQLAGSGTLSDDSLVWWLLDPDALLLVGQ